MKVILCFLLALPLLLITSCSLVTVPVKVAGSVVETTVKTTGDVATAPFKMGSGNGDRAKDSEGSGKSKSDKEKDD